MDDFLGRLGIQAINYAMRCGIALTSTFAIQQCSRLLKTVDDEPQYSELRALQRILDSKIKIVSPALDLIEFKSGRGNVFLGNAASLSKVLHRDIVALGKRLENAAAAEEQAQEQAAPFVELPFTKEQRHAEVVGIIRDIKALLARIDGDIPLLQLAITASGESLSTALPASISPSRLLQASMFLVVGDTQFSTHPGQPVQIGPSFTLSLYMLFLGHSSSSTLGNNAEALFYTDSGRILNIGTENDFENSSVLLLKRDTPAPASSRPVSRAGTAKEERESPGSESQDEQDEIDQQLREESYLLKDSNEAHNGDVIGDDPQHNPWRLPSHLDPEWLALEVCAEDGNSQDNDIVSSDGESSDVDDSYSSDSEAPANPRHIALAPTEAHLTEQMRNMAIAGGIAPSQHHGPSNGSSPNSTDGCLAPSPPRPRTAQPPFGPVVTSLSLLEMLVRLTSLQQFQQTSHLAIPDHILTFFLEEASATGLKGEERWKARRAAEKKMGFDPFTDTPPTKAKKEDPDNAMM
ncbi:Ran-specific GTPase-activating protein 30 [Sporothrix curviconia]|uniref:Ran-specific GTPase-activating protein 30 n=1 Tax=Sporothrix curviconia TaxID=1260050 RepID=A0ABP0BQM2_9PEZI